MSFALLNREDTEAFQCTLASMTLSSNLSCLVSASRKLLTVLGKKFCTERGTVLKLDISLDVRIFTQFPKAALTQQGRSRSR
jgi:hypothetical protein